LSASSSDRGGENQKTAETEVEVGNQSIENLELRWAAPFDVSVNLCRRPGATGYGNARLSSPRHAGAENFGAQQSATPPSALSSLGFTKTRQRTAARHEERDSDNLAPTARDQDFFAPTRLARATNQPAYGRLSTPTRLALSTS
jgi:hypothetical protein